MRAINRFLLIAVLVILLPSARFAFAQSEGAPPPAQSPPEPSKTQSPPSETREIDNLQLKFNAVKLERDILQSKVEDLQRQVETAQQDLAASKKALADLNARLAALEKDKNQLASTLTEARDQARDLSTKLAAEQVKAATLREDKQRLMSGTTTAKEEIARLQKRASELETEAKRAEDLVKRLAERDQEIERLRKATADREGLANKVSGLTKESERLKQRLAALTEELAVRSEEAMHFRMERDQLALELRHPPEGALGGEQSLAGPGLTDLAAERESDRAHRDPKLETAAPQEGRRTQEETPKGSSNGSVPKQATREQGMTLQRLVTAQLSLAKSLDLEISRGELSLQQVRDRLTISVADRALFDPGQAQVKPDGVKLLKKVSDVLKTVPDLQIRVESHPEEASAPKQRERNGNWELFSARANGVMQRLVEDGGTESGQVSLIVSPELKPHAAAADEGRAVLNRTAIIVSPKN
jgi:chemotaxis protein MotB